MIELNASVTTVRSFLIHYIVCVLYLSINPIIRGSFLSKIVTKKLQKTDNIVFLRFEIGGKNLYGRKSQEI